MLANNFLMEAGISGPVRLRRRGLCGRFGQTWNIIAILRLRNGVSRDVKLYRNVKQDGTDGQFA